MFLRWKHLFFQTKYSTISTEQTTMCKSDFKGKVHSKERENPSAKCQGIMLHIQHICKYFRTNMKHWNKKAGNCINYTWKVDKYQYVKSCFNMILETADVYWLSNSVQCCCATPTISVVAYTISHKYIYVYQHEIAKLVNRIWKIFVHCESWMNIE